MGRFIPLDLVRGEGHELAGRYTLPVLPPDARNAVICRFFYPRPLLSPREPGPPPPKPEARVLVNTAYFVGVLSCAECGVWSNGRDGEGAERLRPLGRNRRWGGG